MDCLQSKLYKIGCESHVLNTTKIKVDRYLKKCFKKYII